MRPDIQRQFYERNVKNGLQLDTHIYKWMPLKYVLLMLKNHELVLNQMKTWEDVYENYLIKQIFYTKHGESVLTTNTQESLYGQSWSKTAESDALWRIYSNISAVKSADKNRYDNIAIRIETTAEKLFDAIYVDDNCMATHFIGQVQYLPQEEIEKWAKGIKLMDGCKTTQHIVDSALMKREEFAHEDEVRPIIFLTTDNPNHGSPLFVRSIQPDDFILSFMIDPRLDDTEVNNITQMLVDAGAKNDKISQSKLYKMNLITLQID